MVEVIEQHDKTARWRRHGILKNPTNYLSPFARLTRQPLNVKNKMKKWTVACSRVVFYGELYSQSSVTWARECYHHCKCYARLEDKSGVWWEIDPETPRNTDARAQEYDH